MQEGFQSFQSNFDPISLVNQTTSAILFSFVGDVSPSIESFEDEMNAVTENVFMKELKGSHRKEDIVIQAILFNERVTFKSGFQPILNISDDYLHIKGSGSGTALYEAVAKALEATISYRNDLENQGINVRSNICIISDGRDNSSAYGSADKVKGYLKEIRENEAWANTFTITFIGVGSKNVFEQSCIEMGLDPNKVLVAISGSAEEIRKQMGVVSQSISSNAAATVTF